MDPYWDFEKAILGSGDDLFIGTDDKDYIETGGGSDEIYAGVGGDVIVVQGEDVYASPNYSPAFQTFTVRVQDGVYFIDGTPQPYLNFVAGETYRFDLSDPSNSGHPLDVAEHSDGPHNADYYNHYYGDMGLAIGHFGVHGEAGAYIEFTVPQQYYEQYPELHYFCGTHPGMGGSAAVSQPNHIEEDTDVIVIHTGTRTDPMSGETVSDGDADTVQVESAFSGTLLIKNTGSTDKVVVDQQTGPSEVLENGDWVINLSDGSTITIENYLTYDEASGMHVASGAYLSNQGYYPYDLGFGDMGMTGRAGSHKTDDLLYAVSYDSTVDEDTVYFVNGWDGDDIIHGGDGTQQLLGGGMRAKLHPKRMSTSRFLII